MRCRTKIEVGSFVILVAASLLFSCSEVKESTIDLSGQWQFQMDTLDVGVDQKWYLSEFSDSLTLPGSMAENGKGNDVTVDTHWTGNMWNDSLWYTSPKYERYRTPDNIKVSFWLQPEKTYYGPAWYQKKITIPPSWNDKHIAFIIERAHWESTVWIDGNRLGSQNTLATPHEYSMDRLAPGDHILTVRMDNQVKDIDVGLDAHSITDNTQTNWNGMVGALQLTALPAIHLDRIRITPSLENKEISVHLTIENKMEIVVEASLNIQATGKTAGLTSLPKKKIELKVNPGTNEEIITYSMGDTPALWDEFNPNLYELQLLLESQTGAQKRKETFGFREFKPKGTQFTINDRLVFLRGTLECAIFPLTGYPPTDPDAWRRIFKIIKSHGLNHMRFHSWCPPEAAFVAADELGVYLQVEASGWTSIGDGKPVDSWLFKEGEGILNTYGNHPSFVMMAYGNEPGGKNHKQYLTAYVNHFQKLDPTRVYTGAAGWPYIESADYLNTPKPRIQQWNQSLNSIINAKPPQTLFDYSDFISQYNMPVVSHEIGQWCVYPNFKEMSKYTGVLKPKNFEIFKETLAQNHMEALADSLLLASGKLQTLCYKAEIEAALRTKDFAGFQLLDLHDFSGQGTALVGVLDAFWDEKGYVRPEEFKAFSGQTVPLVRLDKRMFRNSDTLKAAFEVAHFGPEPLKNVKASWKITHEDNRVFAQGDFDKKNFAIGNGIRLREISVPLHTIEKPEKLTIHASVGAYANHWNIWVYPTLVKKEMSDIRVVSHIDQEVERFLKGGGKVLLSSKKGSVNPDKGGDVAIGFSSIFWNTSWTNGQKPHTLGILCDPKHPALAYFPTSYHSDWQWWDAMSYSNAICLDDFEPALKPIVRVIDDWFENRRLALLFEAKIGKGKLLVSGIDFHSQIASRIEAQQLLYSLKEYMSTDAFSPTQELDFASIAALYNTEKSNGK